MSNQLSLVRFLSVQYFSVLLRSNPFQPVTTHLAKLVDCIIDSEPEPDDELKTKIKWIYENTHEKVKRPLSIIELAVFKNLDRSLSREIEIANRSYPLVDLYRYLDEVVIELTLMVIKISKKYAIDMPMQFNFGKSAGGGDTNITFDKNG